MQGLGKNIGVFDPKVGVGSSNGGSSQHPTPVLDRGVWVYQHSYKRGNPPLVFRLQEGTKEGEGRYSTSPSSKPVTPGRTGMRTCLVRRG
jgi:hypothetical protein